MGGSARPVEAVDVMGVPVGAFTSYDDAVDHVSAIVSAGGKQFWVAVNPEKLYHAEQDERLRRVLVGADARICDGMGVSMAARLLCHRRLPRCTGCDLFEALVAAAAERQWRVFFLGASPRSNEGACENLQLRHPDLIIAGRQDGYFLDDQAVVEQINAARADLLFVGMGSPRQEFWIADHFGQLDVHFVLGVGGSLDVASGTARRAPAWCRRSGLEFLHRAITTPGWSTKDRFERTAVKFLFAGRVLRQWLTGPMGGDGG